MRNECDSENLDSILEESESEIFTCAVCNYSTERKNDYEKASNDDKAQGKRRRG